MVIEQRAPGAVPPEVATLRPLTESCAVGGNCSVESAPRTARADAPVTISILIGIRVAKLAIGTDATTTGRRRKPFASELPSALGLSTLLGQ